MPHMDAAQLAEKTNAAIEGFISTQEKITDELRAATTENGEKSAEAIARADVLAGDIKGIAAQLLELQQNATDAAIAGSMDAQTLGEMVVKSDAYTQFNSGSADALKFQANTIIGEDGSGNPSDVLVAPERVDGIIIGGRRQLRIADILPQGNTSQNNVQYTRELTASMQAAETGEALALPESSITFESADAPVRLIGHHISVTEQVIDDAPMLKSYLDTTMRYGVDLQVDKQILNGAGTGVTLKGLTHADNHAAFTPTASETALDGVNRAVEAAFLAEFPPNAIIMNPQDWFAITRLKDGQDKYIIGNPQSAALPVLWGLPVVISASCTAGKFATGAFDIAAQVWTRKGVMVELFRENKDNAEKNLLTLRAQCRKALTVYRPASIQYGNLKSA